MSDTSPINTFLSSPSYESPKRSNSEEVQTPLPNNNNLVSQQNSSQNAKEISSLTNNLTNLIPCQQTPAQTFLCPHDIVVTCVCCFQQVLQRDENPGRKNFEKLYQDSLEKAQSLEASLRDFKEEIKQEQKRVAEITSPFKNAVQSWFEGNVEKLCEIKNYFFEDLDQAKQQLFDRERFDKDIAFLEGQAKVLKGYFQSKEEFDNAYSKEELFRFEILKEIRMIHKRSNSLIAMNLRGFSEKMKKIVSFNEVWKEMKTPAFVNVKYFEAADMDTSTTISSLSSKL